MSKPSAGPFQNPDTREFWAAVQGGRVVIQRCGACKAVFVFPRPYCVKCFSDDVTLVDSDGRGEVYAKTVVQLPMKADAGTGYTVVLVQLGHGIRMLARYTGQGATTGEAVVVSWDLSGETPMLTARPAG